MRLTPVVGGLLVAAVLAPAPALADDGDVYTCADSPSSGTAPVASRVPSRPLQLMGVDAATERLAAEGVEPGEGVKVAVVDSGVVATSRHAPISVERPASYDGVGGPVQYSHGTEVAALVAAHPQGRDLPVGVAPAATVVDLPVYRDVPSEGLARGIPVANVVRALDWLAAHAREERIGVVVLAMQLPDSRRLRHAVHRLAAPGNDVVIVVPSGNRPQEGDQLAEEFPSDARPGEDARDAIFPAGYTDDTLAVGAADGGESVLFNSATDVSAPTAGAVTVDANGSTCVLEEPATSWAAGLVGGVVALVRSAYPDDTAAQVVTRLRETADGRTDEVDRLAGAGSVQPMEALTRVMRISPTGLLQDSTSEDRSVPAVRAPAPRPDPLAAIRHDSLWWGLLGASALVVTALVRPVLARRRTSRRRTGRWTSAPAR